MGTPLRGRCARGILCVLVGLALLLGTRVARAQGKEKDLPTDLPSGVEYPIRVEVAVWVSSIQGINEVEGTFNAEVDLRLSWRDPRAAFDRKKTGLDRQEFGFDESAARLATLWTPQVTIGNMDKSTQEDRQALLVYADGTVELLRRLNAKFRSPLAFGRFPFDRQELLIELRSPKYGASRVVFAHGTASREASGIKAGTSIPNWTFDREVEVSLSSRRGWTGRDHAMAQVWVTARRETGQYFFQLFLPFCTIMLFPPLALWVPKAEVMPRANMAFSGLFSLIALSYSIFVRYPMLAAVDNVIVRMLWLGYLYLAFVLLLIMTVHNPAVTGRLGDRFLNAELASYTTWSVPLLFVIAIASVVVYAA